MELLLNLLWLVIALGSVCVWRGVWRRGHAPSRREWVAFATFLFLIFPVISLTDDLHEELAVAECATGTKHFLSTINSSPSHQNFKQTSVTRVAVLWNLGINPIFQEVMRTATQSVSIGINAPIHSVRGRAPPSARA